MGNVDLASILICKFKESDFIGFLILKGRAPFYLFRPGQHALLNWKEYSTK